MTPEDRTIFLLWRTGPTSDQELLGVYVSARAGMRAATRDLEIRPRPFMPPSGGVTHVSKVPEGSQWFRATGDREVWKVVWEGDTTKLGYRVVEISVLEDGAEEELLPGDRYLKGGGPLQPPPGDASGNRAGSDGGEGG